MQSFNHQHLPHSTVGSLRFFAFFIGNETLLANTKWGVNYPLDPIFEPSEVLGNIMAINLFCNYGEEPKYQDNRAQWGFSKSSKVLMGEYLQSLQEQTRAPIDFSKLRTPDDNNWRDVVVRFFRDLGKRTLETTALEGLGEDYGEDIIQEGSYLEQTAAIFGNVLQMDEQYRVVNEEWARHRASQYIRYILEEDYEVVPAFEEWELCLWM